MGAADVIPGVSGGTIAFLTGIYSELINSIKSIDFKAIKLLFTGKFKQFWTKINGTFLLSLVLGIMISILSLAKVMKYLMENEPIALWSFFFGLIISSAIYILKDVKKWKFRDVISLLVGGAIGAVICILSPTQTPDGLWFIFLCGAIAICAMILPGISGSFILLLMGKYHYIVLETVGTVVSDFTWHKMLIIIVFACGALIGIISFSHVLSWLLKNYYNMAITLLSGFMIGSLVKIWPWQQALADGTSRPAAPGESIGLALLFIGIGVVIVFVIEGFAAMKSKKTVKTV